VVAFQDPVIFSGSLRSNLDPTGTIGDPELLRVLRLVRLGGLVDGTGGGTGGGVGLDTHMAEMGANLSAGERQLVCFARALLQKAKVRAKKSAGSAAAQHTLFVLRLKPFVHVQTAAPFSPPLSCPLAPLPSKVLVLDEATSTMDVETDALIQSMLRDDTALRVARGGGTGVGRPTIVTIAHRLATIADYDEVAVLGCGRVVECGPPAVLLATPGGHFAGMWADAQAETKA